ncbi:hypothetical protein [Marinicella sp. W31]|uniref:hypothetical protein n=1 Tax=Marinicella sp. W31 TaxID=3023713 RepID=UPI0037580A70
MATATPKSVSEVRQKIRKLQAALVKVSMSHSPDRHFRHHSLLHSLKLARKQLSIGK